MDEPFITYRIIDEWSKHQQRAYTEESFEAIKSNAGHTYNVGDSRWLCFFRPDECEVSDAK